jgi:hypothetical protein
MLNIFEDRIWGEMQRGFRANAIDNIWLQVLDSLRQSWYMGSRMVTETRNQAVFNLRRYDFVLMLGLNTVNLLGLWETNPFNWDLEVGIANLKSKFFPQHSLSWSAEIIMMISLRTVLLSSLRQVNQKLHN